jgi:hypothetical protein
MQDPPSAVSDDGEFIAGKRACARPRHTPRAWLFQVSPPSSPVSLGLGFKPMPIGERQVPAVATDANAAQGGALREA